MLNMIVTHCSRLWVALPIANTHLETVEQLNHGIPCVVRHPCLGLLLSKSIAPHVLPISKPVISALNQWLCAGSCFCEQWAVDVSVNECIDFVKRIHFRVDYVLYEREVSVWRGYWASCHGIRHPNQAALLYLLALNTEIRKAMGPWFFRPWHARG